MRKLCGRIRTERNKKPSKSIATTFMEIIMGLYADGMELAGWESVTRPIKT